MKSKNKNLNTLGITLGFSGYLIFVLLDTLIKKYLIPVYPVFEINFFVSLFMLIPILITLSFFNSWHVLINNKIHIQLFRGSLGLLSGALIINSFKQHSFSEIYPILFSAPLILTILSFFFLKEKVGTRRWTAVLIGFFGVLIVSRPGTMHFTWSLFGLFISAIILATNIVIIRSFAKSQSAIAFSFYGSIASIILSSIFASRNFIYPSNNDLLIFLICGIICGVAALCISGASKILESSLFAPIQYVQLVAGFIFGYLFFGDIADIYEILGSLVIVMSGLFIIYRQNKLGIKSFVKDQLSE
jgi:drug/metabolite transporter (DMT)-like permease